MIELTKLIHSFPNHYFLVSVRNPENSFFEDYLPLVFFFNKFFFNKKYPTVVVVVVVVLFTIS